MHTWPRILVMLSCFGIMLWTQPIVPAEAQECQGGYSVTFQLDGEVEHPKTYALQDLLLQPLNWTRVQDFFLAGGGSDGGTFTGILLWDLLQKAGSSWIPTTVMICRANPC